MVVNSSLLVLLSGASRKRQQSRVGIMQSDGRDRQDVQTSLSPLSEVRLLSRAEQRMKTGLVDRQTSIVSEYV